MFLFFVDFLQPAVVASLGSAALVFNFVFAYFLVGSRINRLEVVGTFFIIVGSVLVASFDNKEKSGFEVDELLKKFSRVEFVVYFALLEVSVALVFSVTRYFRKKMRKEHVDAHVARLRKIVGVGYAICGGTVASQTVLLFETLLQLIIISCKDYNQFLHPVSFCILGFLILTVITQVICLNSGLRICDTVTVVPVFFAFYSVLTFFNANIYHARWGNFSALAYGIIMLGIIMTIGGVYSISLGTNNPMSSLSSEDVTVPALRNDKFETLRIVTSSCGQGDAITDIQRYSKTPGIRSQTDHRDDSALSQPTLQAETAANHASNASESSPLLSRRSL